MAEVGASLAAAAPSGAAAVSPQRQLQQLHSLDLSSRAESSNSTLSQNSASEASQEPPGGGAAVAPPQLPPQQPQPHAARAPSAELERGSSGSQDGDKHAAAVAAAAAGGAAGGAAGQGPPPKKEDARSSALKALAGVSAIVSKSRKVDAEALQAIKSQRAKARAEGHMPGAVAAAPPAAATAAALGRATPAPTVDTGTGISPFASASSQGLVRSPSGSNLALGHAASLPLPMHGPPGGGGGRLRRSPAGTPPASAADYDALVAKMNITELVALKQAVEGQLAKQAMALAQLQASSDSQHNMLSQQYAALLLQSAQQAQLVQQLSSQQQAAHAAAIQQALSAAAAAAGITSPTFSPEQLLLPGGGGGMGGGGGGGSAPMSQYASMPLPDMASPFAAATFPPESGFALADGPRGSISLPPGMSGGSKASGSPRSASAEQHLIGEALHSFVDPERQGPPSRQGSALVNGINWSDRRGGGAAVPPPHPGPAAFARSRSLPHGPQDLYHDRSASLNQYLGGGGGGDGGEPQPLSSLFNGLSMADGGGGGPPPSAFAVARSGSLQVPGMRHQGAHGHGHHPGAPPLHPQHMSPTGHQVSFNDAVQTRTYQPGGY